jgi:protein LSM14
MEEVKATAASFGNNGTTSAAFDVVKTAPTGPKNNNRVAPAMPLPAGRPNQSQVATEISYAQVTTKSAGPVNAASLQDATQAAKAAVAVAMAKLDGHIPQQSNETGSGMDNLTKKVNEMRVNASQGGHPARGRGRGGRSVPAKVTVPNVDFDFASSNAKFNKEDLVKEAIASSPLGETPNGSVAEVSDIDAANPPVAYNKTKSFFDNISSEAKDRAETGQKPGGREWRGEEQRKNMETFGQGSVDGGYRNSYRGRGGRGRGMRGGRGFVQRGGGGRGGFRTNSTPTTATQ